MRFLALSMLLAFGLTATIKDTKAQRKGTEIQIAFGHRCDVGPGICAVKLTSNLTKDNSYQQKTSSSKNIKIDCPLTNATLELNERSGELKLIFSLKELNQNQSDKANELSRSKFFPVEGEFVFSEDVQHVLGSKEKIVIRAGEYPMEENGDQVVVKFKLK